ncbi:MAG: hypothetical protein IKQ94_08300 [Bacteroidales bacterium]|nr:hypothetical protein [Bacteroidales bacterium]
MKDLLLDILESKTFWLILICIGVWVIVIQNCSSTRDVYVVDGNIDAEVSGTVSVDNIY